MQGKNLLIGGLVFFVLVNASVGIFVYLPKINQKKALQEEFEKREVDYKQLLEYESYLKKYERNLSTYIKNEKIYENYINSDFQSTQVIVDLIKLADRKSVV